MPDPRSDPAAAEQAMSPDALTPDEDAVPQPTPEEERDAVLTERLDWEARQGAADTRGHRLDVVEAMEREGVVTWGDDGHRARFLALREAAERPLDVDRLTGFLVQAALHEGQHGDFPSIRAQAEWMASEWNDPRSITNLRLAHYAARISPATATPEAGDA
jgi:hypothetical protein